MKDNIWYPLSPLQVLRVYNLLASSLTLWNEAEAEAGIFLKVLIPYGHKHIRWGEAYSFSSKLKLCALLYLI